MAVNFGLLQPQQAPQVVANLPQQSNISPLTNLGTGLAQAGQAMQASQLNNLQIDKAKIDLTEAQDKQQKRRTMDEIVKTSNGNFDAYIKATAQVDPLTAMDAMTKRQQYQALVEQTRGYKAGADKAETENSDIYFAHLGALAEQTMNLKQPNGQPFDLQTKKAFFEKGLTFFPDTIKQGLKKLAPEGYTDSNAIVLMTEGTIAQAQAMKGKEGAQSDTKKRIDELNRTRQEAGLPPLTPEEQSQVLSKGLNSSISNKYANPTDTAIAQADTQTLKDIETRKTASQNAKMALNAAESSLTKTPKGLLGPVQDLIGIAKLNPNAQALISHLNNLTLQAKDRYNLGSQGFTDADRKFVQEISGNVSNYKETLQELLAGAKAFQDHADQADWIREYNIYKKGSDGGDQFLQDNPEPMAVVKVKNKIYQVPLRKRDEFIKDSGGVLQ